MIKKLMYPILGLILLCGLILPTNASTPQPKIELDEYDIEISSPTNVYIEGEVSVAKGQWIQLYSDTNGLPINFVEVSDTGEKEDFKILVPNSLLFLLFLVFSL